MPCELSKYPITVIEGHHPFMPYKYIGKLSDDELKAIYLYLKTVPAAAMGAR